MNHRQLRFESREERQLLAVWAGGVPDAACAAAAGGDAVSEIPAVVPAPTEAVPAGYAVGDVYIASAFDVDGDGFIGPAELSYMSYGWFSARGNQKYLASCDLDGDGFIGPGDYSVLSKYWFKTCDQLPDETKSYAIYPSHPSNWTFSGDDPSKISVQNGELAFTEADCSLEAVCAYSAFADHLRVTFDFTAAGTSPDFSAGIELAVQDSGGSCYFEIKSHQLFLYSVGAEGSMTLLRSVSFQTDAGEVYTFWAQNSDGQLAFGLDDRTLLTYDADACGGKIGFRAEIGTTAFSNISVGFNPQPVEDVPDETPDQIRIATYNIHSCGGFEDSNESHPEWAGGVIAGIQPNVIGLQEVDRNTSRSGWKDQTVQLAQMTGLDPFFAKAASYYGGDYGIGALAGLPSVSVRNVPLPGEEEVRVLLEIEFNDFVFFNTHLSLTKDSRRESAEIINSELGLYQKPVILVGDMNVNSVRELTRLFGESWTILSPELPTYPSDEPTMRLDFILIADPTGTIPVNSSVWTDAVVRSEVIQDLSSDHCPVYVDLDWAWIEANL